jgi:hypothetical protein
MSYMFRHMFKANLIPSPLNKVYIHDTSLADRVN